jgi:hypothetical protein
LLSVPWVLAPHDTSCFLSTGLAVLRASLVSTQVPGHPSHLFANGGAEQVSAEDLALMLNRSYLDESLDVDAADRRAALVAAGYFTHLFQAAEYLESALTLAGQGHERSAAVAARSALEVAWRMDLFLRLIEEAPAEADADRDALAFALHGRDQLGRDRGIAKGVAASLELVRERSVEARSARPGMRGRTEGDRLEAESRAFFEALSSVYAALTTFVHPTVHGRRLMWGRSMLPNIALDAPTGSIHHQFEMRRSITHGCIAAIMLLDSGRESWLRIRREVDGVHLAVGRGSRIDFGDAYPDRDPTYTVSGLRTSQQELAEECMSKSFVLRAVDHVTEALVAEEMRATLDPVLSQIFVWMLVVLEHHQAVQMLAMESRYASAGSVARAMLEHSVVLAQLIDTLGSDPDVLAAGLAAYESGDIRESPWFESALREKRIGAGLRSAEDNGIELRQVLNDLVHPNQMARLLHWNDYVRVDRETGARTGGVVRLAVFPSAAGSGLEQVRDAIAFSLAVSDDTMLSALMEVGRVLKRRTSTDDA